MTDTESIRRQIREARELDRIELARVAAEKDRDDRLAELEVRLGDHEAKLAAHLKDHGAHDFESQSAIP